MRLEASRRAHLSPACSSVMRSDKSSLLILGENVMPSSQARLFCFSVAGKSRELSSGRLGDRPAKEDSRLCFFFCRALKPSAMADSPSPQITYIYGDPPPLLAIKQNATSVEVKPNSNEGPANYKTKHNHAIVYRERLQQNSPQSNCVRRNFPECWRSPILLVRQSRSSECNDGDRQRLLVLQSASVDCRHETLATSRQPCLPE